MKVLIAIDDSQCSKAALAAILARKWSDQVEFKIITVLDTYLTLPSLSFDRDQAEKDSRELLDSSTEALKKALPNASISSELLEGYPKELLIDQCEEFNADLLVVGAHGRRSVRDLFLGRVSSSALINAPCSVMIVKKEADLCTNKRYENVLIAVDESEHSKKAIEHVLSVDWQDDIKFHILTVVENPVEFVIFDFSDNDYVERVKEHTQSLQKQAQKLVDEYAARLSKQFGEGRVSSEAVVGHVRGNILDRAERIPAGLIVMGSHGKGFFERLALGSVSQAIAQEAGCSVEVIRVPGKQGGRKQSASKEAVVS